MFNLLPAWMYRKRHLVLVEKEKSVFVTATDDSPDCFEEDGSAIAVQGADIHAQQSPASTWPGISPQLERIIRRNRTCNNTDTIFARIMHLVSLFLLALAVLLLIIVQALVSSLTEFLCWRVPVSAAIGLLTVKIGIFALSTRLLAHAEMATTGPLVVSYDEDFIAVGDRKIPRRQVRCFRIVGLAGLGKRVCLGPVRDVSYGIQVEAVSGAFVVGFVEDATACETVVRRLNKFLHEMRVSVDEEGPPAVVQSVPVTRDMIAAYAVCNDSSEEAPLASLDPGVFKFRFRLTTSFPCCFFMAVFVLFSNKHRWSFSGSYLSWLTTHILLLAISYIFLWEELKKACLMWIFLNTNVMTLSTFEWLITGKSSEGSSESQSRHVVLVSRRPQFTCARRKDQVSGLISKEGMQYALDLVTPDGKAYQLVCGLRESEAVAAAKRLEEKVPEWF